ncbi:MAG: RloB family protein [Microcoleaceae cyanobacterium]
MICEGAETETNYFRSFPVDKKVISLDIKGEGKTHKSLGQEAIKLKEDTEEYDPETDQIWCVFDRDKDRKKPTDKQSFNAAIEMAKKNNINIAYSNDAFELWYLLHFHYYDTAISRQYYQDMLTKLLGHKYQKNSQTIYNELKDKQVDAMKNAKRLLEKYNPPNPEKDNPSTTVHLLVETLNKFIPNTD